MTTKELYVCFGLFMRFLEKEKDYNNYSQTYYLTFTAMERLLNINIICNECSGYLQD